MNKWLIGQLWAWGIFGIPLGILTLIFMKYSLIHLIVCGIYIGGGILSIFILARKK